MRRGSRDRRPPPTASPPPAAERRSASAASSDQDEDSEERQQPRQVARPVTVPRKRGRPSKAAIAAAAAATAQAAQATPSRPTGRRQAAADGALRLRESTRKSTGTINAAAEPRRKAAKIAPPPLPEAPPLGEEIVARAALAATGHPAAARGAGGGGGARGAVSAAAAAAGAAVEGLEPDFLEDLLACWDFLHLMGVAETEVGVVVAGFLCWCVRAREFRGGSLFVPVTCFIYFVFCCRQVVVCVFVLARVCRCFLPPSPPQR